MPAIPRMKAKVAYKMLTQLGHAPDEKGVITLKKDGNEDIFDNLRHMGFDTYTRVFDSKNLHPKI